MLIVSANNSTVKSAPLKKAVNQLRSSNRPNKHFVGSHSPFINDINNGKYYLPLVSTHTFSPFKHADSSTTYATTNTSRNIISQTKTPSIPWTFEQTTMKPEELINLLTDKIIINNVQLS